MEESRAGRATNAAGWGGLNSPGYHQAGLVSLRTSLRLVRHHLRCFGANSIQNNTLYQHEPSRGVLGLPSEGGSGDDAPKREAGTGPSHPKGCLMIAAPSSPQLTQSPQLLAISARRQPANVKGLGDLFGLFPELAGGHVHERGVVTITATSNAGTANNVVDYESDMSPNSWLCIDFKEATIKMSSYSIQSLAVGGSTCGAGCWRARRMGQIGLCLIIVHTATT
jgi:hypothetical protein